jgi:carboxypeptidase Q
VYGASKVAQFGAKAVIVRSMTMAIDDVPHTGTLVYKEGVAKIPAIAISTVAAETLAALINENANVKVFMRNTSSMQGKTNSPNVIGEIKGNKFPEKVILIGGHLDAWDVGHGAHDDGSGCVQSMEVLHTLAALGYKPNYTIRCVLFSNEESGLAGGTTYAKTAIEKKEMHVAALESDAGGFSPRGFTFDSDTSVFKKYYKKVSTDFLPLMESYGYMFETGGSGADIGPLKPLKGLLIGLRPDSQRYFDYHHTSRDDIDAVNPRELKLGAASMTSLIYLIDKYGLQ